MLSYPGIWSRLFALIRPRRGADAERRRPELAEEPASSEAILRKAARENDPSAS